MILARDAAVADKLTSTFDPVRFCRNTRAWAINSVVDAFHSLAANRPATYLITDEQWNSYASDAMESMKPSLTSNNSLVNFLIELKDFKALGGSLLALYKKIRHGDIASGAKEAERSLMEMFGQRPWNNSRPRGLSKRYSDAWLQWRLAWLPFVSDIEKLMSGIQSFERDVRQFVNREGKRQQRYWGRSVPSQFSASVLAVGQYVPPELRYMNNLYTNWSWVIEERLSADPRFNATMRYRYLLNDRLRSEAGTLNGFLDRLGVNGNPAILWNAIPFTFVVDWFVNVGGYLNKLRVNNIQPVTEISDFCSSVKATREIVCRMAGNVEHSSASAPDPHQVPPQVVLSATSSEYRREVFLPHLSLAYGSGLHGSRIVTAAALVNSIRK